MYSTVNPHVIDPILGAFSDGAVKENNSVSAAIGIPQVADKRKDSEEYMSNSFGGKLPFTKYTVNQRLLVSMTSFFMFANTGLHATSTPVSM